MKKREREKERNELRKSFNSANGKVELDAKSHNVADPDIAALPYLPHNIKETATI